MQLLEECEPRLCEKLLLKKKWQHAQKDPAKAIHDQFSHTVDYWQQLNHLPRKAVKNIVNDRILSKDKQSCDFVLNKILEQKIDEDAKRQIQVKDRIQLRQKLRTRHNEVYAFEGICGVRLGNKFKTGQVTSNPTVESDEAMKMKFVHPSKYVDDEHTNVLAMPKTEF